MALPKLAQSFLDAGKYLRNWSPKTVPTYQRALTVLCETVPVENITQPALNAWVVSLRQRGLEPSGANCYIKAANSFLTWLHESGHLEKRLIIKRLPVRPAPIQSFTDDEVKRLLAGPKKGRVNPRNKALMWLLFDTGLRIDEALGLERKNVDWENLTFRIRGKGSRVRVVPYSPQLRKLLFKLTSDSHYQYVLASRDGHRLIHRNIFRDMRCYAVRCGVSGFHPHKCRHFFATSFLRAGGDLYRLSRILGHSNIQTTTIYLRSINVDQLRESHSVCSPLARLA
jgi:integrase/recombinase XerD